MKNKKQNEIDNDCDGDCIDQLLDQYKKIIDVIKEDWNIVVEEEEDI